MMKENNIFPEIKFVEEANGYVGLKQEDNKLVIYAPMALRFNENIKEKRSELILFLNSINIAKTYEKEQINKSSNHDIEIWPFESYLWIIKDCIMNGYYYDREKKYINDNKGKLEWKKILKNTPIISNGNIIYDKFVTSRMIASNNEIAMIYRYCMKIANNRIGWLFNYHFDVEEGTRMSLNEMKYILNKELSSTFDDLKRLRFKHMRHILENYGDQDTKHSNEIYGITNYYYVFERMVDEYLNGMNEKEKKKFNPKGHWYLNSREPLDATDLRPDTITKFNNKMFIIDSKMYKFGHTGNPSDLPETTSMQKQITYADYVNKVLEGKMNINNIFIIPFDKGLDVFENDYVEYLDDFHNLAYIGYAKTNWRDDENPEDYEHIHTFLIDFNHLLKSYRKDNNIIEIMDNIIKQETESMQ